MKRKGMKVVCLSLMTLMMAATGLTASAAAPGAMPKANTYSYKPYNSDLHEVYINGRYQYKEGHSWQYSGTMVYCSKCGVYK